MQTDYLIVGQGISGTMLSWFLYKEGKRFLVIDDNKDNSASKIAAGIINPVTGRRYVTTWMIEELMSFAQDTYAALGACFDTNYLFAKSIIDFFPSAQMRNAFTERITEDDTWLHSYPDQNHFNRYFHYDFGCGEIRPGYTVHMSLLLADWRRKLIDTGSLLEETFQEEALQVERGYVQYKGIRAEKIIFCDGINAATNKWFGALPFSPNKGEALVIECEGLPNDHLFKKGLMLVPAPVKNTCWVGANYQWEFKDSQPSQEFHDHAVHVLSHWLKLPFKVLFHKAAVRPATLERRPFVGFHPLYPAVGILNGMGTKGTSLAPYFANQLVQHLVYGFPITPEADVLRFRRVLSK